MLKKEFLPLAIFILLVLWATVSFGVPFLEKGDASDTGADSESEISSISTTPPTATDTPTRLPSSTPTFTPLPLNAATPTFTPSPSITPTPFPSNTTAPQPVQNPSAGTVIKNTTLRADGNENSSVVGIAYIGEVFNILEGDPEEEWIKINIADEKIGWARTKNVETMEAINSGTPSASPTPDTVPALLISGDDNYIAERSFINQLESGQQRWYTFDMADQITDINITLLVRPTTNKVSLAVYTEKQFELYEYEDINSPSVDEIGRVDTDLEKDWVHWIGNIAPDSKYFFRVVNGDEQTIEYCLVPKGIESWDKCP